MRAAWAWCGRAGLGRCSGFLLGAGALGGGWRKSGGRHFPCLAKQNAAHWPTPSPLEGHLLLHIPPSTKKQLQTKWQQQPPPQASCLDSHDDQFKASDGLPIGPTSWVLSLSALWPDCQSADVSPLLILLYSRIQPTCNKANRMLLRQFSLWPGSTSAGMSAMRILSILEYPDISIGLARWVFSPFVLRSARLSVAFQHCLLSGCTYPKASLSSLISQY